MRRSPDPRGEHRYLRTDGRPVVEIYYVLVDHPDTAGRDTLADRPGLDGAVDPIERILVILPEVESTRAERIARPAVHAHPTLQFTHPSPQSWFAVEHLLGWIPVRPFLLVVNCCHARPGKAFAAHSDAIATCTPTRLDGVEVVALWVDDDCARCLVCREVDFLSEKRRVDPREMHRLDRKALALDRAVDGRVTGIDIEGDRPGRHRNELRAAHSWLRPA